MKQENQSVAIENDNPLFVSENTQATAAASNAVPNNTTNFTNDESVEIARMPHIPLHSDYLLSTDTQIATDIADFLSKPIVVQSGIIQSTDTSTTFATLEVLASHVSNDVSSRKVAGFLGIRATQVLRLQINANRFQQGRYILFWIPFCGGGNTGANSNGSYELIRRRANKTTVTQLPHVEIDINSTTEAILEIPFVSVHPFYPLPASSSYGFCLGYYGLYPYSPISVPSGLTVAQYTIYSSLKDVKLVAPTYPQMSFTRSKRSSNPTETEQSEKGLGPVSSTAYHIKAIADLGTLFVPALSFISQPVSWAMDIMKKVASSVGYSNPIDLSNVTRAVQTLQPFANNCDMVDASMPLSLFGCNQIEVLPGFAGSDVDEMSIDYIKTIPAYLTSFTMTTAQTAGTKLYALNFDPSAMYNTFVDTGAVTTYTNTPITFLLKLFQVWRGSIRVTFKIVKTEFHSGRIEIVYFPQEPFGVNGVVPNTSTATNRAYVHREIVDIRSGTQIDILLPYVSVVPWRVVGDILGSMQVYVVNELLAPPTVSSSITFLVEVAGGPDFSVNIPRNHSMVPIIPTSPQMSFRTKGNDHAIVTEELGNSSNPDVTLIEARVCIGEQIVSLNSLLKKAENFLSYTPTALLPTLALILLPPPFLLI